MDLFLRFVEILAWPLVALISILVLGPGGVLLKFTESLGGSISNFTRSLPELKSTALTMQSDVETLVNKSREMSSGFSKEFREIETRIESLSLRLSGIMDDVKEVVSDIDQNNIIEEKYKIDKVMEVSVGEDSRKGDGIHISTDFTENLTADQMYNRIRSSWSALSEVIRRKMSPADFDGRQIGAMARRLADGRRRNPLAERDAELVQRLHSQFKRFSRTQNNKDEWLTPDVFYSFQRGVDEATRALSDL